MGAEPARPGGRPTPAYTEFHPRWYRPHVSTYWWLSRWPYLKFVLREISSSFGAWFVLVTLYQVHVLASGPQAYGRFELIMRHPAMLALNLVSLLFVLVHTITWFNLAPKAMVLRAAGRRVPDAFLLAANYGTWVVVSGAVAWLLLGA